MKIILIISTVMIASVLSKTFQECLDECPQCYCKVTPTPVCSINANGDKYKFAGYCEFTNMNNCLGPDAAYSEIPCEYKSLRNCWIDLGRVPPPCTHDVPPTRVCGVNSVSQGTRMQFDGQCEFDYINQCVGPAPNAFTEIDCWD